MSKIAAGQRLLDDDNRALVIARSIAARRGGTPPSGPEARAFQQHVLDEIARAGA